MYFRKRRGFTLVELMVVIAIIGLLAGILAVAIIGNMETARAEMDKFNLAKLYGDVEMMSVSARSRSKLQSTAFRDVSGRGFWEACFKNKMLNSEALTRVVSLGSKVGDTPAPVEAAYGDGAFTQHNCSYTTPRGGRLLEILNMQGSRRTILFSFDSRNWINYTRFGVLACWSEGDHGIYYDAQQAAAEFGISADEWANPGGAVIGRKAPWNNTFEEGQK